MTYKQRWSIVFSLIGVLYSGCAYSETEQRVSKVEVLTLVTQPVTTQASYMGQVIPFRRSMVSSRVEGQVEKAQIETGELVKAGQVLVQIDTTQVGLRYKLALSNYELAKSEYQRESKLFEKKLSSPTQLRRQKNAMEVSYYQMELAKAELGDSKVKAPFAGVVNQKSVQQGEYIKKGTRLFEVMDLSKVKVLVYIPERQIHFIHLGQQVQISLDALNQKAFVGKVHSISLEADSKSRSFLVEVVTPNPEQEILAGMLARVQMVTEKLEQQVVIPRDAVLEGETGPYVYVATDSKAVKRLVQLGRPLGDAVQVRSGLDAGEQLVVVGQQLINHQEAVQVIQTTVQQPGQ